MVLRELVAKLGFDVDEASIARFDQAIGNAKKGMGALGANMQSFGDGVRNAGMTLTTFVTAPLVALAGFGVKTAAELESAKIALEVFLGSEEKALAMQQELIEFAKKTPFQMLGIQETAGQLLSAGVEAEKMVETLNALGNASKGNSEIFQRLVLNFAQVKTQGKLTGRELRDFQVNQVPVVKLLAKELKVTEDAIDGMVSKGAVDFATMERAFFNASKEGGFFFDLMRKQSTTLTGKLSNLKDSFTQLLAEIGEMLDEAFGLKELFDDLGETLGKVTKWLKDQDPWLRKTIVYFATFLAVLGPLLVILGSFISLIGATIASLFLLEAAITTLGITFNVFFGWVGAIVLAIAAIGAAIYLLVDDFLVWRAGGKSVLGALLGDFERWKNGIMRLIKPIKDMFSALWDYFSADSAEKTDAAFARVLEAFGVFASLLWPILWKGLQAIGAGIYKALAPVFVELPILLLKGFGYLLLGIAKLAGLVLGFFGAMLAGIGLMLWDAVVAAGAWAIKAGAKLGQDLWEGLKSSRFGKFIAGVGEKITGLFYNTSGDQAKAIPSPSAPAGLFSGLASPSPLSCSAAAEGMLSASKSNGGGVNNINTKIELAVPAGTPEMQKDFLKQSMDEIFDKKMQATLSNAITLSPRAEK